MTTHLTFVGFLVASWYSDPGMMADGQMFQPTQHVCASKTLPLGTQLELINMSNANESKCRVEDRGPWIPGRDLDVSPIVRDELGFGDAGVIRVRVYRVVK